MVYRYRETPINFLKRIVNNRKRFGSYKVENFYTVVPFNQINRLVIVGFFGELGYGVKEFETTEGNKKLKMLINYRRKIVEIWLD